MQFTNQQRIHLGRDPQFQLYSTNMKAHDTQQQNLLNNVLQINDDKSTFREKKI